MTIRIKFYHSHHDLQSFSTIEEAKASEPVPSWNILGRQYVVLFELNGEYAVFVNGSKSYLTNYLDVHANVLWGGWWEKGKPVEWEPINDPYTSEREVLGDDLFNRLTPPPDDAIASDNSPSKE